MMEKLFARLRSWRLGDPAAPVPAPLLATATAGPAAPVALEALAGASIPLIEPLTPPPLPADAWSEQESGIVITDSGIIILDAEPPRAQAQPQARPRTPATGSQTPEVEVRPAEPTPPPNATARKPLAQGQMEWDDVLERARARAELASPPPPARAKAK